MLSNCNLQIVIPFVNVNWRRLNKEKVNDNSSVSPLTGAAKISLARSDTNADNNDMSLDDFHDHVEDSEDNKDDDHDEEDDNSEEIIEYI